MTDQPLLRAERLQKSFDGRRVLDDVSLSVAAGEVKGVIGPSGAGKSTLIRCLNGLERPDAGRIWLGDTELGARTTNIDALRARIGFVFQDFNLFTHLRVADNLMLGLRRVKKLGRAEAERTARDELARVGLAEKWSAWPAELSGGQAQRVSIARALAMAPEVMLFDEPTSALDPQSVGSVLRVMRELVARGMTMVIVSHEMAFIEAVADDVIFMAEGAVIEEGAAGRLFAHPEYDATRSFIEGITAAHLGQGPD